MAKLCIFPFLIVFVYGLRPDQAPLGSIIFGGIVQLVVEGFMAYSVCRLVLFGPGYGSVFVRGPLHYPEAVDSVVLSKAWWFVWNSVRLNFIILGKCLLVILPVMLGTSVLGLIGLSVMTDNRVLWVLVIASVAYICPLLVRHALILPATAEGGPVARYHQAFQISAEKSKVYFVMYLVSSLPIIAGAFVIGIIGFLSIEMLPSFIGLIFQAILDAGLESFSVVIFASVNAYIFREVVGEPYDYLSDQKIAA